MEKEITDDVAQLFLQELFKNGYDFTGYSKASFKRRLNRLYLLGDFYDFREFQFKLKNSANYLRYFIQELTVNVTEMFRDPCLYLFIRQKVLPVLASQPLIKIWHAGCATGEEVYSMAILLKEAQLLERSLLYATDINPDVLEIMQKGIFPIGQLKQFSENYIKSGGESDFSSYYTAKYDWVKFDESLQQRMVVSTHNLVSDRTFNEFHLIICRNVFIYFNKKLQEKVLHLFDQSLVPGGFLCLGSKETLQYTSVACNYKKMNENEKIWQKKI